MSIDTVRDNNPIDSEDQPATIEIDGTEYVAREEIERKDERIDALEENIENLTEQFHQYRTAVRGKFENVTDYIEMPALPDGETISDTLETDAPDDAPGNTDGEPTLHRHETPLERLLDAPQESAIRITESVTRALSIAGHYKQWSNNRSAGHVIIDGLKDLLSTAMGEQLAWKQVHRACHKLDELTHGKIQFTDHHRHGRILVVEDEQWLKHVVSEHARG